MTIQAYHFDGASPRFEQGPAPQLPGDIADRISEIWATEKAENPTLFDGPVLSVTDITKSVFTVTTMRYSALLAGFRDPSLRAAIGMRPLAVSGILSCPDGLVFGRRSDDVTQSPGCWELVPSGGVPPRQDGLPDLAYQILAELQEEIGLTEAEIAPPVGYIDDKKSGTIDVIMPLRTAVPFSDIRRLDRSGEYTDLIAVDDLPYFLETCPTLLAASRTIAETFVPAP